MIVGYPASIYHAHLALLLVPAISTKIVRGLACIASIPTQIGAKAKYLMKQGRWDDPSTPFAHGQNAEKAFPMGMLAKQPTENFKQHILLGGKACHVQHTCPHVRPYCWNIAS